MKKLYSLLGLVFFVSSMALAQDEGTVEVKDRFERSNTLYFSLGPSFTLGKNLGDYSVGINFETGFLKRANRLLSWGPSLSYIGFAYDDSKTYPYYYSYNSDYTYILSQTGGDVGILSLGLNLKLNFIPVSDNTVFSVYGIVNPFVSYVTRSEVEENVDLYYDESGSGYYDYYDGSETYTANDYPALAADSRVSGGAHLGVGVEFKPAKKISVFAQATFSYTLPITYISTESFLKDEDIIDYQFDEEDNDYYDGDYSLFLDEFPIVKKGFSAVSIKLGMAFNF
ncbi:MAG: hypothetical protein ABI663_10200 [Chryseolinea sp.]